MYKPVMHVWYKNDNMLFNVGIVALHGKLGMPRAPRRMGWIDWVKAHSLS